MQRVECPACGKQVQSWILNMHLDNDCTSLHTSRGAQSIAKKRKSAGELKSHAVLTTSRQQHLLRVFSASVAGKRKLAQVEGGQNTKSTSECVDQHPPQAAAAVVRSNVHHNVHKQSALAAREKLPSHDQSKGAEEHEAMERSQHEEQESSIRVSQQPSVPSYRQHGTHEEQYRNGQAMESLPVQQRESISGCLKLPSVAPEAMHVTHATEAFTVQNKPFRVTMYEPVVRHTVNAHQHSGEPPKVHFPCIQNGNVHCDLQKETSASKSAPRGQLITSQSGDTSVSRGTTCTFPPTEVSSPKGHSCRFQSIDSTAAERNAWQVQNTEQSGLHSLGSALQSCGQQAHKVIQQMPSAGNSHCHQDLTSARQPVKLATSEVTQTAHQRVDGGARKRQSQLVLGRKSDGVIPPGPSAVLQAPSRAVGATTVEGQYVVENFISQDEEAALMAAVDAPTPPWRPSRINGPAWGKRWGVQTDLAARTVTAAALELPPQLRMVADRMRHVVPQLADFFPNEANAILYRRSRGDYLLPHVDDRQLSKGPIVTLSLQGRVYMTLSQEHAGQHLRHFMESHGGRSPPCHPPACEHLEASAQDSMNFTPDICNPQIATQGVKYGGELQEIQTGQAQNAAADEPSSFKSVQATSNASKIHQGLSNRGEKNSCSVSALSDRSRKQGKRSDGGSSGMHKVVLLRPRALQLLTGRSRFNYTHGICSDHVIDERRVSITFRYSPLKPA